eukprot:CAMPEP_0178376434 /NCGR_PEP_ID=MMETSP0689_2-20121128/3401_1 /TAXON_ID=160604 /ORGANISM="Amphidinium massartii, Strain CS-259" /LENGTH=812 /DNA_ID=CAMNT_0019996457 /DNA_START=60 /DNA_END=2496 /DNA_ORIENTATION=-
MASQVTACAQPEPSNNNELRLLCRLDCIDRELKAIRAVVDDMPSQLTLAIEGCLADVSNGRAHLMSAMPSAPTPFPWGARAGAMRYSSSTASVGLAQAAAAAQAAEVQSPQRISSRRSRRHTTMTFVAPPPRPLIGEAPVSDTMYPSLAQEVLNPAEDGAQPGFASERKSQAARPSLHLSRTFSHSQPESAQQLTTPTYTPHSPAASAGNGSARGTPLGEDAHQATSTPVRAPQAAGTGVNRHLRTQAFSASHQQEAMRAATLSMGHSILDLQHEEIPRGVLRPNQPLRIAWDVLMYLATVIVGLVCPVALAYFRCEDFLEGGWGALLYACDACLLCDVFINLRTAFEINGHLHTDPYQIAVRYAKSWLAADIITAWPLLTAAENATLLRWAFAVKPIRVAKLGPLISRMQKETGSSLLLPVKVSTLLFLLAHSMSCGWRLAQQRDGDPEMPANHQSWWDIYAMDTYWMAMTMTTVGYGDVGASGTSSRIFAIVAMLLASLFFAAVVSMLTHATRWLFDDKTEKSVRDARNFMVRHRIPKELQRRAEQSLRHHLQQERRKVLDPRVFTLLSPNIQKELSLALLSHIVLRFPLFRGALHSFVAEVAQAHYWVLCALGDLVAEEGQLITEVVFLVEGQLVARMSSWSEDDSFDTEVGGVPPVMPDVAANTKELQIHQGAWFGEACLLNLQRIRTATFVAATDAELAVLPAAEYRRVVQKFPRLLQRHGNIEKAVHDGKLDLSEFDYRQHLARHSACQSEALLSKFLEPCRTMDLSTFVRENPDLRAPQEAPTSSSSRAQAQAHQELDPALVLPS